MNMDEATYLDPYFYEIRFNIDRFLLDKNDNTCKYKLINK